MEQQTIKMICTSNCANNKNKNESRVRYDSCHFYWPWCIFVNYIVVHLVQKNVNENISRQRVCICMNGAHAISFMIRSRDASKMHRSLDIYIKKILYTNTDVYNYNNSSSNSIKLQTDTFIHTQKHTSMVILFQQITNKRKK